jgi:uncharacterized membrane protein
MKALSYYCKLTCLALVLCLALPFTASAEMTVRLTNKTTKDISVAFRYKNSVSNEWITQGWWTVKAMKTRSVDLDTNNSVLYFYGKSGKTRWGGKEGQSGSVQHTVISETFMVKGDRGLSGSNARNVWFKRKDAKNRVFTINFQGD